MVCILIKTLLELEDVRVSLLVQKQHEGVFKREMKRWFASQDIEIFGSVAADTAGSLYAFLQYKGWKGDEACLVLQSDFPLVSKMTLEHFVQASENAACAVLGTNRTRWNEDRPLHALVLNKDGDRVESIEDGYFEDYGFIPCTKFIVSLLLEHLPACRRYYEVVHRSEEKPVFVKAQAYPIEMDSISIQSAGDKTFAENKFMEKQHAEFLSQCYCLWNRCKNMEQRLQTVEHQLKK
jgi:hypothetical protein